MVRENEFSNILVTSEGRELIESGDDTSTAPPTTCSVTNSLVNFQIRILETDCISWGDSLKQSIANAFEDEIMRIIQLECNCTVTSDFVQTIEPPTCSTMINNGVVFRGKIETNSVDQTENVFCALSNWQQSSPSVNINGQLFTVDSNCFIRVDSFSSPECSECLACEPSGLDPETLIIIIIGAVFGVVMVFLIICCVCCCCRCLKKNTWRPPKGERPDPYDRSVYMYIHFSYKGPVTLYESSKEWRFVDCCVVFLSSLHLQINLWYINYVHRTLHMYVHCTLHMYIHV